MCVCLSVYKMGRYGPAAAETEPECWSWGGGWVDSGLPDNQPSLGLLFQKSLQRPSEVRDFLVGCIRLRLLRDMHSVTQCVYVD